MNQTILIATNNSGKAREVKALLKNASFAILSLNDLEDNLKHATVEETGESFSENAILKAKTWGELTGLVCMADDSGLVVDALDGRPGIYSKRYGKTDADRITRLLEELADFPNKEDRSARFITAMALYDPAEKKTKVVEGLAEGYILKEERGVNGFGYDPVFYSLDLKKTFAEASLKEKNQVSHRAKALMKARNLLQR